LRTLPGVTGARLRESGQTAVETALTMPLVLFMILGTLQLFMLMQGRLFAEHAAWAAARVGSVRHAACKPMTQAAMLALLPSFSSFLGEGTRGNTAAEKLVTAYRLRTENKPHQNRYDVIADDPHDGAVFWILRPSPRRREVGPQSEDDFDSPDGAGYQLEVKLVYWYPLRIPFANWVMATMYRAYFGLGDYSKTNPLLPAQQARWTQSGARLADTFKAEFLRRYADEQWVFPVVGTATMRMMTPPRAGNFSRQNCEPAP
jgi:hypothetical protein